MVTTAGLALFALAIVLLTRAYVSINPPDFLRQYRDPDGNFCSSSSRHYLRSHVLLVEDEEEEERQGGNGEDDDEGFGDREEDEKEKHGEGQEPQQEHELKQDESGLGVEQARSRLNRPHQHTMNVVSRQRTVATKTLVTRRRAFSCSPEDMMTLMDDEWRMATSLQDDKQAILRHLRNSFSSSSPSTSIPPPPTLQPPRRHHYRQWLDLDISTIHYHGSLEPFANDFEILKTIQTLKTSATTNTPEHFARSARLTVVWEKGQWCCLEGRTLYVLKAVAWEGRVRAQVLVDQGGGGDGAGAGAAL
ncbi:MAG: hypothetical protein J3R72DRAFT_218343 [Linnemannia gamsii]|nr:MAG: hypothetical protein J3R72DRAFT_218343 [Linnemannia gamsii]